MIHTQTLDHQDPAVARRIHAVLLLAYAQEAALLQVSNTAALAQTAEGIQHSAQYYVGAVRGDQLLGWLSLGPDDEPRQLNIALLVVHPHHQRQGIARALVVHVLRQAEGAAFSVVAAADNLPALALYRQLGFVDYRRGTLGPEARDVIKLKTRSNPLEFLESMHGHLHRNR